MSSTSERELPVIFPLVLITAVAVMVLLALPRGVPVGPDSLTIAPITTAVTVAPERPESPSVTAGDATSHTKADELRHKSDAEEAK